MCCMLPALHASASALLWFGRFGESPISRCNELVFVLQGILQTPPLLIQPGLQGSARWSFLDIRMPLCSLAITVRLRPHCILEVYLHVSSLSSGEHLDSRNWASLAYLRGPPRWC